MEGSGPDSVERKYTTPPFDRAALMLLFTICVAAGGVWIGIRSDAAWYVAGAVAGAIGIPLAGRWKAHSNVKQSRPNSVSRSFAPLGTIVGGALIFQALAPPGMEVALILAAVPVLAIEAASRFRPLDRD